MVELDELLVADAESWRAWLATHHGDSPGVWLVLHKKGGAVTALTYDDAVDEALCFGWIDSQIKRRDEQSYQQRFTPRRPRGPWSASNVTRIGRLADEGRMHPAGQAEVDAAKADGRWEAAYAGQRTAVVPPDLAAAIAANRSARAMFKTLTAANRYALIYRVGDAKRADTRARRIAQFVEMLARGETIHPQQRTR